MAHVKAMDNACVTVVMRASIATTAMRTIMNLFGMPQSYYAPHVMLLAVMAGAMELVPKVVANAKRVGAWTPKPVAWTSTNVWISIELVDHSSSALTTKAHFLAWNAIVPVMVAMAMARICARNVPMAISLRMANVKVSVCATIDKYSLTTITISLASITGTVYTDLSSQQRDSYVNITRLLTYFGMCVATCVIFQSSTHIAYIVGGAVAIYIAASEYWLNWTAQSGAQKPEIDTQQLEALIMKSL